MFPLLLLDGRSKGKVSKLLLVLVVARKMLDDVRDASTPLPGLNVMSIIVCHYPKSMLTDKK